MYLILGRDGGNCINLAQQRDNLRTSGSKVGGEFVKCLRNSDTILLSYLFRSCRSQSLMLFILSHKEKTKYTVRAALSVDESYKADGTYSILRGVRV